MSSRREYGRGGRSWDREDRDRGDRYGRHRDAPPPRRRDGRSRSRSPRGDRQDYDRRDYARDRDDGRRDKERERERDRERKDDRQRDDRNRERRTYVKDDRKEPLKRDGDRDRSRERDTRPSDRAHTREERPDDKRASIADADKAGSSRAESVPQPRQDSEMPEEGEEAEPMDATNEDDDAMMAMMGLAGFGSTKGKRVEGNQEGTANVKKMRTWRQYMNRRGGFNRPLDKIK